VLLTLQPVLPMLPLVLLTLLLVLPMLPKLLLMQLPSQLMASVAPRSNLAIS